jgi:hypothetical protein
MDASASSACGADRRDDPCCASGCVCEGFLQAGGTVMSLRAQPVAQ